MNKHVDDNNSDCWDNSASRYTHTYTQFFFYLTLHSVLFFSFTMSQVLVMLDPDDGTDKACNTAVVPQHETDVVLSDCDSDGSDMDYEGVTGHLPARLLNAYSEFIQTDHDRNEL